MITRRWFIIGSAAALAVPSINRLLPEAHTAVLPPIHSHVKRLARFSMYLDHPNGQTRLNIVRSGTIFWSVDFISDMTCNLVPGDEIIVLKDEALVFDIQPKQSSALMNLLWLRSDDCGFSQNIKWDQDGNAIAGIPMPLLVETRGDL